VVSVDVVDLGPFAPEQGPVSTAAGGGAVFGAAALVAAAGIAVLDASNAMVIHARPVVLPLAAAGIISSLLGFFDVAVRGRTGSRVASIGLGLAIIGGISGFVIGAVQDGTLQLGDFGRAYFEPEILRSVWRDILRGAVNTLKLAGLSEALGIGVGLLIATLAISKRKWLRVSAIAYVDVIRGLPLLVLLLLIYFGLTFVGVTLQAFPAAILGLTINSSAYIAEIFRAGIQSVERGQMDASRSLGMPYPTAMMYVVIPQAVRRVIPPLTNEFIALVKDTSLVIILGATVADRELLQTARQAAAATFSPTPYTAAAIMYLVITLPLTRVVTLLERRLRSGLV
jgi:polar amino acid transport system permease protein